MYNIIRDIIAHTWTTSDNAQQYIYYICGACILLIFAFTLDCFRAFISRMGRKS